MNCENLNLKEFIENLAGDSPAPGGGGASALAGAIGMALGNMVGSLTVGKKKYAEVEKDILKLKAKANVIQDRLLDLVYEDAEAFLPLARAYKMPGNTDAEKKEKADVMEKCLLDAALPPLKMMEACCSAIELQKAFAEKGNRLAVSDAGSGAVICRAALQGASLNVLVNTRMMKNRRKAEELEKKADKMLKEYSVMADGIFDEVRGSL